MALEIVLRQIAVLAILVLLGLAASRAKVITSASKDVLARIIFYITLPALLFTNFSKIDLTPELLSGSLQTLLLSLFVLLFMLLVGIVTSKLAGLREARRPSSGFTACWAILFISDFRWSPRSMGGKVCFTPASLFLYQTFSCGLWVWL